MKKPLLTLAAIAVAACAYAEVVYEVELPTVVQEQKDYNSSNVEFDYDAVCEALGVTELTTATVEGVTVDNGGNTTVAGYTANGIGYWYKADGAVTDWGTESEFFIEYSSGNTFVIGQYAGLVAPVSYTVKFGFCVGDKQALLGVTLSVEAPKPLELTVAGNQDLAMEIPADIADYSQVEVAYDAEAVCTALGVGSIAEATFVAKTVDGWSSDQNADYGFWFSNLGDYKGNWGEEASLWVSSGVTSEGTLGVGLMPGLYTVGDVLTAVAGFMANDKVVTLTVTVTVVSGIPVPDPSEVTVVAETALPTVERALTDGYDATEVAFDYDAVCAAIEATDLNASGVFGVTVDNNDVMTISGYTGGGKGYWYKADGTVTNWGDESAFYIEYYEGGVLNVGQFPDYYTTPTVSTVKFGFCANNKVALLGVTVNVGGDVSGIEGITLDTEDAEYYDLHGLRVRDFSTPGLYIRRTASGKTCKVLVR